MGWEQCWLRSVQREKKMVGLLTRSTDLDLKSWHFWIGSANLEEEGGVRIQLGPNEPDDHGDADCAGMSEEITV